MFEIDVQGNSGHGAQPDLAVDAIVAGSAIVGRLQTIVSRKLAPAEPAVVTVGTFNGGERWNV
ncbi:MAG: peptidase dimerization domain-containing protein, partial [Mogibacterium diversum]|nr:peptidase dimerization domain-containing protein [Mogibacterium diversum]